MVTIDCSCSNLRFTLPLRLLSLFGKPFDGGKRMDHGVPQQQHPAEQQHPAMMRLYEVHKEVASLGPQVCNFSGLQAERDYKRLERELTALLLAVDQVDTEGRAELQGARKRAAQEVEGLLRYLEENATHPSRGAIEELSDEARRLVDERVVAPQRSGGAPEINDELVEALQVMVLKLTQVKTEGRVPLRKARYRALTRLCAVQAVVEGRTPQQTLSLPLPGDTHRAVHRINQVMAKVSVARGHLVALLMGLSGRDSCAHLNRLLTEMQAELDAMDVSGNAAIRNYRKQVVEEINGLLKHLDLEGEGEDTRRYESSSHLGFIRLVQLSSSESFSHQEVPCQHFVSSEVVAHGVIVRQLHRHHRYSTNNNSINNTPT